MGVKGEGQPGSLKSPVPGKSDEEMANEYLSNLNLPQASQEEMQAASYMKSQGMADQPPQPQPTMAGQAMDYLGRGLDYAGGLARTGLAAYASTPQPMPAETEMEYQERLADAPKNVVTKEDVKKALKGEAPAAAEYMRRMGVPEGGSLDLPGLGKVTTRGAAGLATEVVTDPLTVISKLAKTVPYIGKLINSAGLATEAFGEAVYKSAFKSVDDQLVKKGKKPISDALIEGGAPTGSQASVAQKVHDMSDTMGKMRQAMYNKASELGVSIDTSYPLKRAEALLSNMRKDPGLRPSAEALEELLNRYKSSGKVTIDQLSEWKSNLYDALPATAFDGFGKLKNQAKAFKAALAHDFKDAIVGAGNKAEKGLGDGINAINEKWGTLINAMKPMEKVPQGNNKFGMMIDGALLGGVGVKGLAAKKAFDMATSTQARTLVGKALMEAGKNGISDAVARKAIIEASKRGKTPPEE